MKRSRLVLRLLLVLCPGIVVSLPAQQQAPPTDTLRIEFLDVGQADAILIKLGPRAVLVDASRGDDIVQYLEEEGVDSLVAAITSHNHDDHVGGMDAVLYSYPVGLYLSNGHPPENQNTENVVALLEEKYIPHPSPPWSPILLGDVRITAFPSSLPAGASENNSSLGVLVERGSFKALMTGDSEEEELSDWLKHRKIPDVAVLKAAHHGARNGLTPGWLNATRPEVVVISVGAGNSYGHPDSMAIRYYSLHQRRVLRTDRDGTVVVSVDPAGNYTVTTRAPIER